MSVENLAVTGFAQSCGIRRFGFAFNVSKKSVVAVNDSMKFRFEVGVPFVIVHLHIVI